MVATWVWIQDLLSHRTMGRAGTSFQVTSRACNSPLLRMLRASITSSRRRKLSGSLWRASKDSQEDWRSQSTAGSWVGTADPPTERILLVRPPSGRYFHMDTIAR